jgi:hypothetical protein
MINGNGPISNPGLRALPGARPIRLFAKSQLW